MATYSKSARSYTDIHQAFEQAGLLGSLTLTFDTYQQATTWVGRANSYRVLLRRQNEAVGREHVCEFDHLMLRRRPKSNVVSIEPRGFQFTAVGPDGTQVNFDKRTFSTPVLSVFDREQSKREAADFLNEFDKPRGGK